MNRGDRSRRPVVTDDLLRRLVDALGHGQWSTAMVLSVVLDTNERALRDVASQSRGQIISGQQGYKLTGHATAVEVNEARRWLISQGDRMIQRARDIGNVFDSHDRARTEPELFA